MGIPTEQIARVRRLRMTLARCARAGQAAIESLITEIENLPDNPRIERLSANAFVLRSKDLGNNWTTVYHDFKAQHRAIVAVLRKQHPSRVIPKLRSIARLGVIDMGRRYCQHLHPDVRQQLRDLLQLAGAEKKHAVG